jgi:hypothetical protein
MNELPSENLPIEAPMPGFNDRSTGLTIFGVLTILLGCIAALFALLMLAMTVMASKLPNAQATSSSSMVMALLMYGGLAVALVWLGIGSMLARRWARALLAIFSWAWLVMGTVMVITIGFILPKVWETAPPVNGQPAVAPGAIVTMTIVMLLFFSAFFVVVPGIWAFFYSNRHVKATCEMRDPVPRWTDACPLPVLALCLWLLFGVPVLLVMPVLYHGVAPFFGMLLTGLPGTLLCLAAAALWAYCAWRLYKMDVRGWWLILVAMLLYTVSGVMTFARHDTIEMYHVMGYPQAQIDQIQKMNLFTGNSMLWMTVLFMVPFLGYVLFVKKYLPGGRAAQA